MATHDYVIDNSTGANVRADINEVLKAILTNNGGSTDPATVISTDVGSKAFSFWADTNTNFLKIRNAGDNAWINLLSLDGSILLADGSASSPSLSFSDDPNTGIFSSAADTFNIATGGAERFVVDSSGRVGINGSGVNGMLEVRASGGGGNTQLTAVFGANEGTTAGTLTNNNDKAARIGFNHYSTSEEPFCFVSAGSGSSANNIAFGGGTSAMNAATSLTFHTAANTTTTTGTQRMSIDSSGRVLLGTTTEGNAFADDLTVATSGTTGITIRSGSSSTGNIYFSDATSGGGEAAGFFEYNHSNNNLSIGTNESTRITVDSSGNVGIGTSSPTEFLQIHEASNNTRSQVTFTNNSTGATVNDGLNIGLDGSQNAIIHQHENTNMLFGTNDTERFRINSSGFFQYNNTVDISGIFQVTADGVTNLAANKLAKFNYNASGDVTAIEMRHGRGGLSSFSGKMISFLGNDGTEEGSININVTSTSYNTSSDYRLKENEVAISDGITKLKQLKPYRFNFKKDPDVKVDGFFAHEVASVVPNAVTGEKDAMEAETRYEVGDTIPEGKVIGDPKTYSTTLISPQQLDHSKLVPLLVAAVQELIGKVEALEAA